MDLMVWGFLGMLALFTTSGALAWIRKRETTEDYLVASREISPWLSALSAVSTNNSGFMFIGMIAYTYRLGIEAMWMMIGFILGDLTMWFIVHARLRRQSRDMNIRTIPAFMGTRSKSDIDRLVIITAGLITFIFLGVYAAGQLKAGAIALQALFEWNMAIGVLIGAFIVILYSFAGGIRADIWTDAAQSLVMIATMALILIAGMMELGGLDQLFANLREQDPDLLNIFPTHPEFGLLAYLAGWFFAGTGAVGQPHLMTRFFALESSQAVNRARKWYFMWYVPFFIASIGVGLYCRALMPDLATLPIAQDLQEPTELALPLITKELLPGIFVGVSLAGLFAATVSTADSQIIVCSGALTNDIAPKWRDSYIASKIGTFSITAIALGLALYAPEGVFGLVLIAWSAMGASLGSVLVIRVLHWPLSSGTAVAMMIASIATVSYWHVSGWNDDVFKILPGLLVAFGIYGAAEGIKRLRGQN